MRLDEWREEPISKHHLRAAFDCGDDDLNTYLRRFARQNHERGGAKTFVAVSESDGVTILGYYSLSPASIAFEAPPAIIQRNLGRYDVPVFRLGRLAVDRSQQGHSLGGALLLAAGRRCLRVASEVGGVALLIDAKNDRVTAWYARFGAVPLSDAALSLVLPLDTMRQALVDAGHEL